MKKILFTLALAATVFSVSAQTAAQATAPKQHVTKKTSIQAAPQSADQRAVAYSKELQKKLSLDDAQYTKVLAVNTECIRRKDALKHSKKQDPGGSKAISQYRMEQYQTILKPEQLAKLKAMNAQGGKKGN